MADQVLLCPACGSRNRPAWEFCARCGESLQDETVRVTAEEFFEDLGEESEPEVGGRAELPGGFWLFLGVVLLGANAVACLRFAADAPPPATPDPGIYAALGNQPTPPPAAPSATGPGAKDYQEGQRLLAQKRFADALPLLTQAASAAPDKADYQQALALAYWGMGNQEQALTYYQQAASLEPGRYRGEYARALDGAGRTDDAAREYQSILAQGDDPRAQESLGRLYARTGNFAAAAPLLEKAAAAAPTDPLLIQELAFALEKTNDPAKATEAYRRVVALAPDAPIGRSRLAETLVGQGKADEAVGVLKEGLARSAQQPLLQRQLGSVLERSGNLADAAKAYREYIQLAPNADDAKALASRAETLDAIVAQRQQ